jgi:hypothetical protein
VSATPDERNSLTRRIDRLYFREYARVGWLKAVTFTDLALVAESEDWRAIGRYLREDPSDALRREMIRVFLSEWLPNRTPESMGGWGAAEDFGRCERSEALRQIDRIIEATLEAPEAVVGRRLPWLEPDDADDDGVTSYAQLRSWFANDLFDPSAAYFVFAPLRPPGSHSEPCVIGMDRRVIAMFWLE